MLSRRGHRCAHGIARRSVGARGGELQRRARAVVPRCAHSVVSRRVSVVMKSSFCVSAVGALVAVRGYNYDINKCNRTTGPHASGLSPSVCASDCEGVPVSVVIEKVMEKVLHPLVCPRYVSAVEGVCARLMCTVHDQERLLVRTSPRLQVSLVK